MMFIGIPVKRGCEKIDEDTINEVIKVQHTSQLWGHK